MTKLEIIKINKAQYQQLQERIPTMSEFSSIVAEHVTLKWIKGVKWMGGISDSAADKAMEMVHRLTNRSYDDIYDEFHKQMNEVLQL